MLDVDPQVPVLPGEDLAGKYRVERVLGNGAMGVVVAAHHLQLDERVAIKFLRPEVARDSNIAERFVREGRAAAKIRGEHVVRVFDVGRLDDGSPYLVMEYVDGIDLSDHVAAEGALEPSIAIDFVLQACDAIAQAHAAGIIHRDIKPSNLLLSHRPNGSRLIKVLDFGISKMLGERAAMTQTVAIMGSPLYMSPEQLLSSRDVDERTDIWSLGIVLFELLAGEVPFDADTMPQLCVKIRESVPKSLREIRPDVSEELESVVLRCLNKAPQARYSSVNELASELEAIGRQLVSGTPDPAFRSAVGSTSMAWRRESGYKRRESISTWSLGLGFALCLAGVATWALRGSRTTQHASSAPAAATPATPVAQLGSASASGAEPYPPASAPPPTPTPTLAVSPDAGPVADPRRNPTEVKAINRRASRLPKASVATPPPALPDDRK